jgi:hypothetical protein
MISQYDNLLPFLAERFSGMPFFDLQWYLMGPRELEDSVRAIEAARPRFLFVDTDVDRPRGGDLIRYDEDRVAPKDAAEASGRVEARQDFLEAIGDALGQGQEAQERAERLGLLGDVFARVRDYYVPVARGRLITVYERKDAAARGQGAAESARNEKREWAR